MRPRSTLYFLIVGLLFSACVPNLGPSQTAYTKNSDSGSAKSVQAQILQKPSYQGPVHLRINTGLLNSDQAGQTVDLTERLNQSFQIQNTHSGPMVFQERFTKGQQETEFTRSFSVSDTSQRFTLRLAEYSHHQSGWAELNVNGNDWITARDFAAHKSEIERTSLLLNAHNKIRIRLHGQPGYTVTISIFEGGEAGAVLRRQGRLGLPGETQTTHLRQNDTNIFDPNLPSSLGGLTPYEGHLGNAELGITGVVVDHTDPIIFEAGTFLLQLNDPENTLLLLQSTYGAEVINDMKMPGYPDLTTYYLKFDLSKSPIQDADTLIQIYREQIPAYFNDFTFASVDSFQTFILLLDILVHHPDWIHAWDLNYYNDPPSASLAPTPSKDWNNPSPRNLGNNHGWWLRDTFAREAWKLSIGTGINVAYLDAGFENLLQNSSTESHPEIDFRRIILGNYSDHYGSESQKQQNRALLLFPNDAAPVSDNVLDCNNRSPKKVCTEYGGTAKTHGMATIMPGYAQRDNGIGTAGVAPNANLKPYNNRSGIMSSYFGALEDAVSTHLYQRDRYSSDPESSKDRVDVIEINMAWAVSTAWQTSRGTFLNYIDFVTTVENIPIVVSAGNFGIGTPIPYPSSPPDKHIAAPADFHNLDSEFVPGKKITLIVAGGAARDPSIPAPIPSAGSTSRYEPNSTGTIQSWAGSTIPEEAKNGETIWVPAEDIEFENEKASSVVKSQGTSYSAPILAATVALMKSRNPDLTPRQILDILKQSSTHIPVNHDPSHTPTVDQPFLDIQDALERAVMSKTEPFARDVNASLAREYPGKIVIDQGAVKLQLNDLSELTLLDTIADDTWNNLHNGNLVLVRGWQGGGNTDGTGSPIRLGPNTRLTPSQLEISQIQNLGSAGSVSAQFAPNILEAQITGSSSPDSIPSSGAFTLELTGERLMAFLNPATSEKSLKLYFHEYSSGSSTGNIYPIEVKFNRIGEYLAPSGEDQKQNRDLYAMKAAMVLDSVQDATVLGMLKKTVNGYKYKISIEGANGESPEFEPPTSSGGFSVSAEGGGSGGYSALSVNGTPPNPSSLPSNSWIYKIAGIPWLGPDQTAQIDANEFAGIHFNQPVKGLSVKIGPVDVPIVDVLQDLAIIGIPDDLPAGVHDVIIKSAEGNLTLENAVEKVSDAIPTPHEPTAPPSSDPGAYSSVHLFNIEGNDEARAYLNDELLTTAHAGDDIHVPIGANAGYPLLTDQRNVFRFELDNNGGGYTYGFEIQGSNTSYYDMMGEAGVQNVLNDQGQEDQTQGKVYNQRFITYSASYLPLGRGDYWVKVFNMNNDEEIRMETSNETGDPQWANSGLRVNASSLPIAQKLPWIICSSTTGLCTGSGKRNNLYTYLSNSTGNFSFGLEVYKGVNLVYRRIEGQAGGWGAYGNSQDVFVDSFNYTVK